MKRYSFRRFQAKVQAAQDNKVTQIDTATAGLSTSIGSQTFSTITFASAGTTSINRVNTSLFQPYYAVTLYDVAASIPKQAQAINNTWNPTAGYNFNCIIQRCKTTVTIYNPCNVTAYLTLYSCKARVNQFGGGAAPSYDTPEELLWRGWNTKTTTTGTLSTVYSNTQNVREDITIYDSPLFTQQWKVVKTKQITLKPGKSKVVSLPMKKRFRFKQTDYWLNTQYPSDPLINWTRGTYMYLWRIRGQEGMGAVATFPTVYTYPTTTQVAVSLKLKQRYWATAMNNPWTYIKQGAYNWLKDTTSTGSADNSYVAGSASLVTGRSSKDGIISDGSNGNIQGAWFANIV